MTSFIKIFSNHFPEIDITKPAFHNKLDESIINKDFFAYSIVNTLALTGKHINCSNTLNFIQYKFKILKDNILTSSFISDEKRDYYFYNFERSQILYRFLCKCARKFKINPTAIADGEFCVNCAADIKKHGKKIHRTYSVDFVHNN